MTDEDVIRRRLLIDGDGTGDDRKLNNLLKKLIKWSNTTDLTTTENQQTYDLLLSQLSQCEFAVRRSQLQEKTNENQLDKYKLLQSKLEKSINDVKDSIEMGKQNLSQAKVLKQNRMMYDLLAQSIKDQPARIDTDNKLAELRKDLNELEDESRLQEQKLNLRKKQFHVLVSSANQLRGMIEDVNNDDLMSSSLDDITNSPGVENMSD